MTAVFFLCAALATTSSVDANATAVPPAELAHDDAAFASVQQQTRTFQAQIVQTLHLQGLAQPLVSVGTLSYASPDKLLIRFTKPAGEWMLVNGSQALVQKTGRPLERHDLTAQGRAASHAASLLDFFHADPARWHHDFDVAMTRTGDRLMVHLQPWMTPTSTAQGVQEVVTTLQLPQYDIVEMTITINAGNSIDYQFMHGERNVALDPKLFEVPAP